MTSSMFRSCSIASRGYIASNHETSIPKVSSMRNPSILIHVYNSILSMHAATRGIETKRLVAGTSRLSNDTLQLINLRLGTTESTELNPIVSSLVSLRVVRCRHTRFFASLRARLSLEFRRSSITRRSYGASLFIPN